MSTDNLKSVRNRRHDALSRIGWAQLEILLAQHYRGQGYAVEHVGTGGNGRRFDGGIDLKLRREDAYVLVQSKHWNAYQVTHNAVHELLGIMVNEGATGAILVSSGEFTTAAIGAARRQGHVKLVDGDALRTMLGPLLDVMDTTPAAVGLPEVTFGGPPAKGPATASAGQNLWWVVALIGLVGFVYLIGALLHRTAGTAGPSPRIATPPALPVPQGGSPHLMQPDYADAVAGPSPVEATPPPRPATAAEIREAQRRADEAIKVIEKTTPEM